VLTNGDSDPSVPCSSPWEPWQKPAGEPVSSIGLAVCAALLSDLFWYFMAGLRGGRVLTWICRITLEPDSCVRRTENIFARYGARSLLIQSSFPGWGVVSMPLAGIIRMPLSRSCSWTAGAFRLRVGAYTFIGYLFGRQLGPCPGVRLRHGRTFLVLVASGLAIYVLRNTLSRRRFIRDTYRAHHGPRN